MISVKMTGGPELAKALATLSTRLSKRVQIAALTDGANLIAKRASELAPRAPGLPDIADHILVAPVKSSAGEKLDGATAAVGIGVSRRFFYDTFLEFGTKHASAHAFYRPALDELAQRVISLVGSSLYAELVKAGALGGGRGSSSGGGLA